MNANVVRLGALAAVLSWTAAGGAKLVKAQDPKAQVPAGQDPAGQNTVTPPWKQRPVRDPGQPTAAAISTNPYLDNLRRPLAAGSPAPLTKLPLFQSALTEAPGDFDVSRCWTAPHQKAGLVIFWAFWCDTWKDATGELDGMDAYLHAQDIGVVAVAVDAAQQPVARPAFARGDIRWPVAIDVSGSAGAAWGVRRVPTAFLVDDKGVIREVWEGLPGAGEWIRALGTALASKKPAKIGALPRASH